MTEVPLTWTNRKPSTPGGCSWQKELLDPGAGWDRGGFSSLHVYLTLPNSPGSNYGLRFWLSSVDLTVDLSPG